VPDWFDQADYRVRLEWGRRGARAAAERKDVLVVVDVLSFSTAAITAAARGITIYPCATKGEAEATALRIGGETAVARPDVPDKGRFSLSPVSFADAPEPVASAKVALASPNGATCSRYGREVPRLFVGALVNAAAVAVAVEKALEETGAAVTILACGERWTEPNEDGELRFALEDYLGAGAIISKLPSELTASPEAEAAAASFRAAAPGLDASTDLEDVLLGCGSGVELAAKGYRGDVLHAARLNLYSVVPTMQGGDSLEAFLPVTQEAFYLLETLCDRWIEDVLEPQGFIRREVHARLENEVAYPAKRLEALLFGGARLDDATDEDERFIAIHDFLNYYTREALEPFRVIHSDYAGKGPDHPFYQARRDFILAALQGGQ
jgi:2-phosphosulfolactate phosphatase